MKRSRIALLAAAGLLALGAGLALADDDGTPPTIVFPKSDVDAAACGGEFPNVSVSYSYKQNRRAHRPRSRLNLRVKNGAPKALYTVWVRTTEPSPLTGKTVSPLVKTKRLKRFAKATPDWMLSKEVFPVGTGDDGKGRSLRGNSFRTNHKGKAVFRVTLDYWLHGGMLPFNKVKDDLTALPIQDATTEDDRTLTIVSHCGGTGHGLVPSTKDDPHQGWFHVSIGGPKVKAGARR